MAALRIVIVLFVALAPSAARADPVDAWAPQIEDAARRVGLPQAWIARVMRIESGGKTKRGGRPIRSRVGAMGLMQLMPATWADMRVRLGLGPDPDDPEDNILAGSLYLRLMYDRFGYPGLFGAYNAGPERYAAYLSGRASLPSETRVYLAAATCSGARNCGASAPVGPGAGSRLAAQSPAGSRPEPVTPDPRRALFFALRADAPAAKSD